MVGADSAQWQHPEEIFHWSLPPRLVELPSFLSGFPPFPMAWLLLLKLTRVGVHCLQERSSPHSYLFVTAYSLITKISCAAAVQQTAVNKTDRSPALMEHSFTATPFWFRASKTGCQGSLISVSWVQAWLKLQVRPSKFPTRGSVQGGDDQCHLCFPWAFWLLFCFYVRCMQVNPLHLARWLCPGLGRDLTSALQLRQFHQL